MMAELVDEHVGDDRAQRLLVLGPVVEDGAAVEPDGRSAPCPVTGSSVVAEPRNRPSRPRSSSMPSSSSASSSGNSSTRHTTEVASARNGSGRASSTARAHDGDLVQGGRVAALPAGRHAPVSHGWGVPAARGAACGRPRCPPPPRARRSGPCRRRGRSRSRRPSRTMSRPRRHVPRVEIVDPEPVEPPGGDVGEIERRRARGAQAPPPPASCGAAGRDSARDCPRPIWAMDVPMTQSDSPAARRHAHPAVVDEGAPRRARLSTARRAPGCR